MRSLFASYGRGAGPLLEPRRPDEKASVEARRASEAVKIPRSVAHQESSAA